jgi:cbb3-type cytochrome c oxidase subunit III
MKELARIIVTLALTFLAVAAISLSQSQGSAPDGAALFKKHCTMCHGADGKGFKALKTPDFTSPEWQAAHSDAVITETIKNGKKGTAMPAMAKKLNEDEIKAVVARVRSFNSEKE